MPDCAIFADTQWESAKTYEMLAWLESRLPFPVHRVSAGSLKGDHIAAATGVGKGLTGQYSRIPFFTPVDGRAPAMLKRSCTGVYKLAPLLSKVRELAGLKPGERCKDHLVTMLIGISFDEAHRMKPPAFPWIRNSYPLVERRITRLHCLEWMRAHQYPRPPRSSCLGCPFHSDEEWLSIKTNSPQEWAETVAIDRLGNDNGCGSNAEKVYMHRSLKNLADVDFRTAESVGQADMFGNECEGMCGV